MHQFRLSVTDYRDSCHWYWRLADSNGNFIIDHEVSIDPSDAEHAGFVDLPCFLRTRVAPDRRRQDEPRLVERVGAWIGRNAYGPIAEKFLAAGTPVTVRVEIPAEPEEAAGLLYRPWELGHACGKSLALQDVSLVFEIGGEAPPVVHQPVEGALRMLAVFSLPTDVSALNLRHERYELARLIRGLARQRNLAIDLRVLQYGVTRKNLKSILEEGEGWDPLLGPRARSPPRAGERRRRRRLGPLGRTPGAAPALARPAEVGHAFRASLGGGHG